MNKAEFIDAIVNSNGMSKVDAENFLKSTTSIITTQLQNGDQIVWPGLGTFTVNHRAARKGRNPHTGEEIQISAKRVPKFKAAKALKDAVDSPAE